MSRKGQISSVAIDAAPHRTRAPVFGSGFLIRVDATAGELYKIGQRKNLSLKLDAVTVNAAYAVEPTEGISPPQVGIPTIERNLV